MCFLLVGIHCYLGIHVLKRGVIFIDLSLAQVASLGSTLALVFHFEHHTTGSYFISLLFTLLVALYFAWAKKYDFLVSQEVLIALVYALSSSLIVLSVNMMAHGAEHIKEILVGQILWVTWGDVYKTAMIYLGVFCVHYFFRKPILNSTMSPDSSHFIWDFLFYALFGIVITSSVSVAGILLVFAFLVVPALISQIFYSRLKEQLIFGWVLGFALCALGMFLSYFYDLPAGALLVCLFTLIPLVGLFFAPLLQNWHRKL